MSRRIWGPIAGFKRALMSELTTAELAAAQARRCTGGQKLELWPRQFLAAWSMCGDLGIDGDRRYTVQHNIDELTSVNGASG